MEPLKKRVVPKIHRWNALLEELEAEKAVNYFATSLMTQTTIQQVLWDVVRNCISRLNFVDCVIYWLDQERGILVQKAAFGPKNPEADLILQPIEIALGAGIVGDVATTGTAERVGNTSVDSRYIRDDCNRLSESPSLYFQRGKCSALSTRNIPNPTFSLPSTSGF